MAYLLMVAARVLLGTLAIMLAIGWLVAVFNGPAYGQSAMQNYQPIIPVPRQNPLNRQDYTPKFTPAPAYPLYGFQPAPRRRYQETCRTVTRWDGYRYRVCN